MKKTITTILILIILFNSIVPNFSYATTPEAFSDLADKAKATVNASGKLRQEDIKSTRSAAGAVTNVVASLFDVIFITVSGVMSLVAMDEDEEEAKKLEWFTIEDLVFDRINLFSINFFTERAGGDEKSKGVINKDVSSVGDVVNNVFEKREAISVNSVISRNVKTWYNALRNLSIVIALVMLIYIGIRMAIATVAESKAKYKSMLTSWFTSFVMLFVLHYIIIIAINSSESLIVILSNISTGKSFELAVIEQLFEQLKHVFTGDLAVATIVYGILIFYQLKFFFLYAKRLLSTAFLVIIAPIITITYSMDKAGDNKAQAFSKWIKEFVVNVFIQPLHAMLYLVFMFSAYEIAKVAPILAILFFIGLSRGEKIVKEFFKMRGMKSINSMSETMNISTMDTGEQSGKKNTFRRNVDEKRKHEEREKKEKKDKEEREKEEEQQMKARNSGD